MKRVVWVLWIAAVFVLSGCGGLTTRTFVTTYFVDATPGVRVDEIRYSNNQGELVRVFDPILPWTTIRNIDPGITVRLIVIGNMAATDEVLLEIEAFDTAGNDVRQSVVRSTNGNFEFEINARLD